MYQPLSRTSSSSSSSSTKLHTREAEVRLLPPLLKDQAWGLHAHEALLLFCLALGPGDTHVHWLLDGRNLDTPVMEFRQQLGQAEVLVSSWVRERPPMKDARYQCVAESKTGSDTSEVNIHLPIRDENIPTRDLNQWRSALTEHEQLIKRWEKALESCDGNTAL
ncbi:hypothetical protein OJAV_G00121480 [Oryzias javanicus]|uniref:Ig-like domain-containing protein n=1 Tax=Oryzias javanicus TaxID=123683 RepID=A0A437CSN4_ORYJA|nr:hypothetical protein OJAV_G00121480 [Oryzias javanicus]